MPQNKRGRRGAGGANCTALPLGAGGAVRVRRRGNAAVAQQGTGLGRWWKTFTFPATFRPIGSGADWFGEDGTALNCQPKHSVLFCTVVQNNNAPLARMP